jgi:hypothetical protein
MNQPLESSEKPNSQDQPNPELSSEVAASSVATEDQQATNSRAHPVDAQAPAQPSIVELLQAFQAAQAQTPYRPISPASLIPPSNIPQLGALSIQQTHIVHGNALAPALLDTLERHAPGAVAKMLTMAEKQQEAVLKSNASAQEYTRSDIKRAHYIAAALSVIAIGAALASEKMGYPWVAGTFLAFPVPAIINSLNSLRIKTSIK